MLWLVRISHIQSTLSIPVSLPPGLMLHTTILASNWGCACLTQRWPSPSSLLVPCATTWWWWPTLCGWWTSSGNKSTWGACQNLINGKIWQVTSLMLTGQLYLSDITLFFPLTMCRLPHRGSRLYSLRRSYWSTFVYQCWPPIGCHKATNHFVRSYVYQWLEPHRGMELKL